MKVKESPVMFLKRHLFGVGVCQECGCGVKFNAGWNKWDNCTNCGNNPNEECRDVIY